MGSRGSEVVDKKGRISIPESNREYTEIAKVGNISVIQCDTKSNNPTPIFSNTKNTTYYGFSKEHNRIEHIYYYKDNILYKSVDFKEGEEPHTHYWPKIRSGGGRKRHDKRNIFELSDKDKRLMKNAQDFNRRRNG